MPGKRFPRNEAVRRFSRTGGMLSDRHGANLLKISVNLQRKTADYENCTDRIRQNGARDRADSRRARPQHSPDRRPGQYGRSDAREPARSRRGDRVHDSLDGVRQPAYLLRGGRTGRMRHDGLDRAAPRGGSLVPVSKAEPFSTHRTTASGSTSSSR